MKIIINRKYGGFELSKKAKKLICKAKRLDYEKVENDGRHYMFSGENRKLRVDKDAISVVENLGKDANTKFSDLRIAEIPDKSFVEIIEFEGIEYLLFSESEIKEFEFK